jgi:VWFA-related protein
MTDPRRLNHLFAFVVAVAALLLGVNALAQQPSAPTFRAQTELVLVPAVVTDRGGAHITGLKRDDFVLLANGKEQKVAVFEEVVTRTELYQRAQDKPGEFSNRVRTTAQPQRITIILLDLANTEFADRAYARDQVCKFLAKVADTGEPIAVLGLTAGGARIVHDFTSDPRLLAAAIGKSDRKRLGSTAGAEPAPSASDQPVQRVESLRQAIETAERWDRGMVFFGTQTNLQQVAQAYGGLPGRKTLIWITGRVPFSSDRTIRMLNDARFAVYPVDARGLVNPDYIPVSEIGYTTMPNSTQGRSTYPLPDYQQTARARHQRSLWGFRQIAERTGGKPFYNGNDLVAGIRAATQDSSQYYLLGFYVDKSTKPGDYPLTVRVRRPGVEVRARTSFSKPEPEKQQQQSQDEMTLALRSPLDFTMLPLTARFTGVTTSSGDKKTVRFDMEIPGGALHIDADDRNHMMLDVLVAALASDGTIAGQVQQTLEARLKPEDAANISQTGMTITRQMDLPPGTYRVRFIVRDALKDAMGALSAPLEVAP